MNLVPLGKVTAVLESGARPKGGVTGESGDVPSLGGEHLSREGGFNFSSLKFVEATFYDSLPKGRIRLDDILIVKDGATTGKVSFVPRDFPFERAAVNEHVFRLQSDTSQVSPRYLFHFLFSRRGQSELLKDFRGATVGGISRAILDKTLVPLPRTMAEQERIATILDKADAIRRKRREGLKLTDEFLRSTFLDLFGDPVSNSMGWSLETIDKFAEVKTGNTPSRDVPDYYGDHIEWIKSDNINTPSHYLTKAIEGLSEAGLKVGRSAPPGSILITCIAGSPACIGNAALSDRRVAFNQQINALIPHSDIESEFLYANVLFSKPRIQAASTQGMKGMVSKGALEQVRLIKPPSELRQHFVQLFLKVVTASHRLELAIKESDQLFQSLSAQAFNGELAAA